MLVLVPIAALSLISIARLQDVSHLIVAICVYGFFGKLASDSVLAAAAGDTAPKASYGTAYGIFHFVDMSSSTLAPTIAGPVSDAAGRLAANLYISAAILMVGMAWVLFLREKSVPPAA